MSNKKNPGSVIAPNKLDGSFKIILKDNNSFALLWEKFCNTNITSLSYSLKWLDFCKKILRNNFIKDLSFLVVQDDKPLSIVPLIMENGPYGMQFSIKDGYLLRSPVFALDLPHKTRRKIEKMAFSFVEELAKRESVTLHRTLIDPLCLIDQGHNYNYLLRFGYANFSILTSIIDLRKPKDILWGNVRKSHKTRIKSAMGKYEVVVMDSNNITGNSFSEFKKLYFLASGRHIYNDSEWDVLRDVIKRDQGVMALAKLDNEAIGVCFFTHLNGKVYYSLAANHPQYEKDYFIGHLLIWKAVEYYRERKFMFLEMGWQFYPGQLLEKPTDKEINISQFKNGFGGSCFPLYRGTKFFNHETREKYIENNLKI